MITKILQNSKNKVLLHYYQKDKDSHSITNWRPISLLNVDYKVAFKAIANKIKTKLPSIISPDQTGFIKGRYIGKNVRIVHETIEYVNNLNKKGLIFFSVKYSLTKLSIVWTIIS